MPAAAGLFFAPGAMARAPMAASERQLMVGSAGLDQEEDHAPSANIKRLGKSHRAYDEDCAADGNRSLAGTEAGAFGDARRQVSFPAPLGAMAHEQQDQVPPSNVAWLDKSHRARDDDCCCGADSESCRDDICNKSSDANLPEEAALRLQRTAEAATTGFNEIRGPMPMATWSPSRLWASPGLKRQLVAS